MGVLTTAKYADLDDEQANLSQTFYEDDKSTVLRNFEPMGIQIGRKMSE